MRKNKIFLDLEKLNGKDKIEVWDILKTEKELFWRKNSINNVLIYYYSRQKESFMWVNISNDYIDTLGDREEINLQQFKELFQEDKQSNLKQVGTTLEEASKALKFNIPTDLKIGQEIEVNGFVLKVDREVKKWYVNKDTMKFIKSNYQPYGASLITDQDFINQLEKHSK